MITISLLPIAKLDAQDSLHNMEKPVYVHGSFLYDFPQSFGATAGMDVTLQNIIKQKVKSNGKIITHKKDLIVGGDIGFYRYQFNHTGLMLFPYIGMRSLYKNGTYFERSIGAGALYALYDGLVYSVDDNGNVKPKKNGGRLYGTLHFSLAYGLDLLRSKKPKPFAAALKPMLWVQYPYNGIGLLHLSMSVEFKYCFGHLKALEK